MNNRPLWGDNILRIELDNFLGITQVIDFKTTNYDHSFRLGDNQYFSSMYLTEPTESELPINPYEILLLIISSLDMDISESGLFNMFEIKPSFIYLDFLDQGVECRYKLKLNKYGIIAETLFEKVDDIFTECKFESHASSISSSLPKKYTNWITRIRYYSYITINEYTYDSDDFKEFVQLHYRNMEAWGDDYTDTLVEMLNVRKYGISRIELFKYNIVRIYLEDKGVEEDYLLLEEMDEHFINFFLLLGVTLDVLSLDQGVLFMTNCDLFDDLIIMMLFRMFNKAETNTLGSQLIFTGNEDVRHKVTLDRNQIILHKN